MSLLTQIKRPLKLKMPYKDTFVMVRVFDSAITDGVTTTSDPDGSLALDTTVPSMFIADGGVWVALATQTSTPTFGTVTTTGDATFAGTSKDPLFATDQSADKIAFFGATLASQQSDPGALTVADGTGTNDGTIGAITADASVIAAVQELAAKINTLRTALRNLGLCA